MDCKRLLAEFLKEYPEYEASIRYQDGVAVRWLDWLTCLPTVAQTQQLYQRCHACLRWQTLHRIRGAVKPSERCLLESWNPGGFSNPHCWREDYERGISTLAAELHVLPSGLAKPQLGHCMRSSSMYWCKRMGRPPKRGGRLWNECST